MSKGENHDDDVKILHRMIAYLRDEAERLSIAEVAALMERAEDAIEACVSSYADNDDDCIYPLGLLQLVPTEH